MSAISSSVQFIEALRAAVGLPRAVNRVVVEAEVGQPLRVYVRGFLGTDAVPAAVRAVADAVVAPDGAVAVTPREPDPLTAVNRTLLEGPWNLSPEDVGALTLRQVAEMIGVVHGA